MGGRHVQLQARGAFDVHPLRSRAGGQHLPLDFRIVPLGVDADCLAGGRSGGADDVGCSPGDGVRDVTQLEHFARCRLALVVLVGIGVHHPVVESAAVTVGGVRVRIDIQRYVIRQSTRSGRIRGSPRHGDPARLSIGGGLEPGDAG